MGELVLIDRVGGLANYLLLCDDARLYDLYVAAIMGEGDAQKLVAAEVEQARKRAERRK